MRWPLPQTLFARLFLATVAAIATTLLLFMLAVIRERSELAFTEGGWGTTVASIVEVCHTLAQLPPDKRREEMARLHKSFVSQAPGHRHSFAHEENVAGAQRVFADQVQKQLGSGFAVAPYPAGRIHHQAIVVRRNWGEPLPDEKAIGIGIRPPPDRMFDLVVMLPDGDRVAFRMPSPHGPPPVPLHFLVELGVLTLLLGVVLFAMTRTITRPLADLARAADAVGRGTAVEPLEERGARELRRATRAFNAMRERLSRYLDSRTRVLASMSHDLRTPLTRLRLRIESIANEQLRQRCAEDLDEMTRMVRGALSMFRGLNDEEQATAIDMNALLAELQRQYAELGAQVTIAGQAAEPFVGKPLALKRCLGNLLDNALRYGTRAEIVVEDGSTLIVRVLDDGPGIPEESLEQVFEPFFRLEGSRNRETGGAGLGLSIARDVAQSHGGSLVLSNRPGGGLEAALVLPRHVPAGGVPAKSFH